MTQIPGSVFCPGLAVLTALPKEYAAVRTLLDSAVSHAESDHQGTRFYTLGTLSTSSGSRHKVALALVGVGNNISAVATTQLLNDFPTVRMVILCGIAGGVPNPNRSEDHVRLGDIVVSDECGIIQYDFTKEESDRTVPRHPPRPPSSNFVRAARMMEAGDLSGFRPWDKIIDQVLATLNWKRPPESWDLLTSSDDHTKVLEHPADSLRIEGLPRVFMGPIASANTLLKSPRRRDHLRDTYNVKAVEMEGSGTADAAWMAQAQHFVIRGICDYCDINKGDHWQNYAAAAAAGYLGALLQITEPIGKVTRSLPRQAHSNQVCHFDVPEPNQETLNKIDETQALLTSMLAHDSNGSLLVPTVSWIASIDRKFHQNRLLSREIEALNLIHTEVTKARIQGFSTRVSTVEILALNLLERYESSSFLRTNWEARCAIGNSLTCAVSRADRSSGSRLVKEALQASTTGENWDMAQMLFDAFHHTERLTETGRDFLLCAAIEHEHSQVRWNVAAALKSIPISDDDLRWITARLLRDPSPWVVKELIDAGLRDQRLMRELERPENTALLLSWLDKDNRLLTHLDLSLHYQSHPTLVPRFAGTVTAMADSSRPQTYSWQVLAKDYLRVEQLSATLEGLHGRRYKAAERVVVDRISDPNPDRQQSAIIEYLRSTHDALAWASVRALFSGKLDNCSDTFFANALSNALMHPSDWVRRECVEETLRQKHGRQKYHALRQIETNRKDLIKKEEIRPYLIDMGICIEA